MSTLTLPLSSMRRDTFYLNQKGETDEAVRILKGLVEKYPQHKDAEMLLKEISR